MLAPLLARRVAVGQTDSGFLSTFTCLVILPHAQAWCGDRARLAFCAGHLLAHVSPRGPSQ